MDHVGKAIPVVDQTDVFSDDDIAVMSRRWGQGDQKVSRNGTGPPAKLRVEHDTHLESRLEFGRQPISVSKSSRWVIAVRVVPITRGSSLVVVERHMVAVPLVVMVAVPTVVVTPILIMPVAISVMSMILCERPRACQPDGQRKNRRCAKRYRASCSHVFSPNVGDGGLVEAILCAKSTAVDS
jgi:hypothetical protein